MQPKATVLIGTLLVFSTQAVAGTAHLPPVNDLDFHDNGAPDTAKVGLGRALFFDKILSGNLNISCASCHHPMAGTGDGLSLPVGEGARGLGATRNTGTGADAVHERVPRNAPPIFNLGAREFEIMFHDGRLAVDPTQPSGFTSPAGDDLPMGLDNALAAQAMFPVTSGTEMAGQSGENEQADAAAAGMLAGPGGVWELIAEKLAAIPEYVERFRAAYPTEVVFPQDITFVQAANAIAAFEAAAWRFDNSSFDKYLRGERKALSQSQYRGMKLFYGKADCSGCHSGPFQTDHQFYSIAMPQIGPGKGDNLDGFSDGRGDFGRERVTGNPSDRFRFRTPTLRNVELTAPYGHSGAFDTLESVVRHHLDSRTSLKQYDPEQLTLPSADRLDAVDQIIMDDADRVQAIADSSEVEPIELSDQEVSELLTFLGALTDSAALDMRKDIPERVPSGLPVWD